MALGHAGTNARTPGGDRLRETLHQYDIKGEKAIALGQAGISVFILMLHVIAQLRYGWQSDNVWVITALAALFASSIFRHSLVASQQLRERMLDTLTFIDIVIFLALLWSYQFAYMNPAGSVLKAPSLILLPVLIALRALRFHPRPLIIAGATACAGWCAMVALAMSIDGLGAVTHDYSEYLASFKILLGAELERFVALAALTGFLAFAAKEARDILSSAAHVTDYSEALTAAREHLARAEESRTRADEAVAELQKRDKALTDQNERFNAALENMTQGLCMFDGEQKLIVCNEKYATMYGLTMEQARPGTLLQDIVARRIQNGLYAGDNPQAYIRERRKWATSGVRSSKIQEFSDGRSIALTRQPMSDGGWLTTHEDVTERERAKKELKAHRDELQRLVEEATGELKEKAQELERALAKEKELNDLQRQFVSMASHELRTPLAIIDGAAQRLKNKADGNQLSPEDTLSRVRKIRTAVKRMAGLMERTLMAARIEDGDIGVKIERCDIAQVLADVCIRQQDIANDHIITCTVGELPHTIMADPASLEQIFTNLLSNAVKYAPEAPDIEVTAHTEGEHVIVSVRDEGVGIDAADLANIGKRFFRARTSVGIAGTGIGLNLCNQLVAMHGGTISVKSERGEGSTFSVRLPIKGPQSEKADSRAA